MMCPLCPSCRTEVPWTGQSQSQRWEHGGTVRAGSSGTAGAAPLSEVFLGEQGEGGRPHGQISTSNKEPTGTSTRWPKTETKVTMILACFWFNGKLVWKLRTFCGFTQARTVCVSWMNQWRTRQPNEWIAMSRKGRNLLQVNTWGVLGDSPLSPCVFFWLQKSGPPREQSP